MPSQPQTGSYCMVHIQSGLGLATHTSLLLHEAIDMVRILSMMYAVFIVIQFTVKIMYYRQGPLCATSMLLQAATEALV